MSNPFLYVKSINEGKDLFKDAENAAVLEKEYNPYLVNKAFSFHNDTIFFANEMNRLSHLDKFLQYSFFINMIRPKKRWSEWYKKMDNDDIKIIQEFYSCNENLAKKYLECLTPQMLDVIKKSVEKGGENERR